MDICSAQNLWIFANNRGKYVLIGALRMEFALEAYATVCRGIMVLIVLRLSALLDSIMIKQGQCVFQLAPQEHTLINIQYLA